MGEEKLKILLVDDEDDILEFISYNLEKEGFAVYTATNGREALRIAEKNPPHLILLDLMMPEMDGIVTCEEIRKIPALGNTLVAFLTARGRIIPRLQDLKPAPTITSPNPSGPRCW